MNRWCGKAMAMVSVWISAGLASSTAAAPAPPSSPPRGVLVMTVTEGNAGWDAGLRDGDVVTAWRSVGAEGEAERAFTPFDDPWDWTWMGVEWAPRGDIELKGVRNGEARTWRLPGGADWGVPRQLPPLPGDFQHVVATALENHMGEKEWATLLKKAGRIDSQTRLCMLTIISGSMGRDMPQAWQKELVRATATLAADQRRALALLASCLGLIGQADAAFATNERGAAGGEDDLQRAWHLHENGAIRWRSGDQAEAAALWQQAYVIREQLAPHSLAFADSLLGAGVVASASAELDRAQALQERALAMRQELGPHQPAVATGLYNLAILTNKRGDLDASEAWLAKAIALLTDKLSDAHVLAACYNLSGVQRYSRGDLDGALVRFGETLTLQERTDPGSLAVASTLNNMGVIAEVKGDFAAAIAYQERALEITTRIAPGSREVASNFQNLGAVALSKGDLARAQSYMEESLAIYESEGPRDLDVATCLESLGAIAWSRGDLAGAESYFMDAQKIRETLAPDSLHVATGYGNLGLVMRGRGDLEQARRLFEKSLAIDTRLAPDSLSLSATLNNLGELAAMTGDTDGAKDAYLRVLEIQEKATPGGLEPALTLANLGELFLDMGDLTAAEDYLKRSLKIRQALAPGGLQMAGSLYLLGRLARARHQPEEAGKAFQESLAIWRDKAPGSDGHASAAHILGMLLAELGRKKDAVPYLKEAVDALESQMERLGGSREQRESFAAGRSDYWFDLMSVLVDLGENEQAFGVFEKSRARSLRQLLAQRDLVFTADVPADLDVERRELAVHYDETLDALAGLNESAEPEQAAALHEQLADIRARLETLREEIAKASPRFSALVWPQPLDLAGARAQLPEGTVALAYAAGEDSTLLYVLGPQAGAFRTLVLPMGREALGSRVTRLRETLTARAASGTLVDELARILLEPAAEQIRASRRVLVLPDGPLHVLPWALFRTLAPAGADTVNMPPVHSAPSMTLYRDLRREQAAPGPVHIEAFGDPAYAPSGAALEAASRSVTLDRKSLTPLPGTRRELKSIGAVFPGRVNLHLGAAASEAAVKRLPAGTRMVHIAVHGFVDPDHPLDSALAFSTPAPGAKPAAGADNGFLQVWEVLEQVRIPDADLVVLSACETALGKDLGGEGIVGLGRAFEVAGASSVLVSLWSISDYSTALLMEHFYRNLAAGQAKDLALFHAQRTLAAEDDGRFADPYFWAPFVLIGRP